MKGVEKLASDIQLYLNNGDTFNVASLYGAVGGDMYPNNAYGLVLESNGPVKWLNLQPYVKEEWHAHYSEQEGHTYGYFGNLERALTKADHQEAVDFINNNGAFIWGDIYNGGLYLFKSYYRQQYTTGALYAFALFAGYGVSDTNPDIEQWKIMDYPTMDGRDYESLIAVSVVCVGDLDKDVGHVVYNQNCYNIITAGEAGRQYDVLGVRSALNAKADINLLHTDYEYIGTGNIVPITEAWQSFPAYAKITPANPSKPDYYIADEVWYTYISAGSNNGYPISGTQDFASPEDEVPTWEGYSVIGNWAGGDGNYVGSDPNSGSNNSTGGGYGTPSKQSDRSGDTGEHQFDNDGTDVGCFTIFNPTIRQMQLFNSWLFQSLFDEGLTSIWNNLKKMYADPSEYIIGCGLIKYHPDKEISESTEIKFANVGTGVAAREVKQWTEISWDPLTVNEQFKSFLDYQGFSTVKIFLPFCGTYDLDQNDIMDATLNLKYNIDNLTGACVAVLDVTRNDRGNADDSNINSKIYRFNGNCMQQLPITAKDYTNALSAVNGLCASVVTGIGSAVTGNVPGMIGSVAGAVSAATNMSPTPIQSGKISDAYGMLDCLVPFLILHRPIRSLPDEYGSHHGYPASRFVKLGTCKGYTKIRTGTAWLDFVPCTDEEQQEIINYLENGIMMNDGGV